MLANSLFVVVVSCLFIFERERDRETEREWGRGGERCGDPESEAGSRL